MKGKRIWTSLFLVMFIMSLFIVVPETASAASFKDSKPTIKKAQYLYDSVSLQWSKVSGAKSYEIQRSKMNPKTGKFGSYKLWATTTETSIVKKATGDCQYRVRAVSGKKTSKWSAPKRVFAAYAKIVDRTLEAGGFLTIEVKITNKTNSPMGLTKGYVDDSLKSEIQFFTKKGKKVDVYHGDLYSGSIWDDDNYMTDEIPANKTKTIYLRTSMSTMAWWDYSYLGMDPSDLEHHVMKIVTKFYPNPYVENTTMKLTYTDKVKKSITQ